jgi:hypothetical protein
MRLLHLSYEQTLLLLKNYGVVIDISSVSTFHEQVSALLGRPEVVAKKRAASLEFKPEFRDITDHGIRSKFYDYLEGRLFEPASLQKLIDRYQLKCALVGDYANRIIIPIYLEGKLVSWTARSIYPNATLRYRNLPKEESVVDLTTTVYNYDHASQGGRVLFVHEGPVDTFKVDFCGFEMDIHAIGIFGMNFSTEKQLIFRDLSNFYDRIVFCLDQGEELQAISSNSLFMTPKSKTSIISPPFNKKDVGEVPENAMRSWLASFLD